jgi:uncharacterized protein YneF (UPF0154 family)
MKNLLSNVYLLSLVVAFLTGVMFMLYLVVKSFKKKPEDQATKKDV